MSPTDMGTSEFIKWLATLGVGGVIAGLIFMFYRKDVKQYTELWKTVTDQLITTVRDNTSSNVKLIAMIESQERNQLRKGDIMDLIEARLALTKRDPSLRERRSDPH
jgi:hypothetical protein